MRLVLFVLLFTSAAVSASEITYQAEDGLTIYADWYKGKSEGAAVVILFHQAGGSARGEYPYIIERLTDLGLSVLAVDQRSGGTRFGPSNRTVDALERKDYGYCEAWPDLQASIMAAKERSSGEIVIWGSSYSAGLVLRYAALHGDMIEGALAFSPASGEPMAKCDSVELIDRIQIPTVAFRPAREMENPRSKAQADKLLAAGVGFHVIEGGVHGSSMLVPDRSEADMDKTWRLVESFVGGFHKP